MSDHPIKGLMDTTLEKIREMVDVNTIIGEPIVTSDGTTIIPVSKIVYGFASGGSEFGNKHQPSANLFGGGGGAGVTLTPVAFLVINNGNVTVKYLSEGPETSVERVVGSLPELVDKLADIIDKFKKKDDNNGTDESVFDEDED